MDKLLTHASTEESLRRILSNPAHGIGLAGPAGSGKGYLAYYIASRLLSVKELSSHPYTRMINANEKIGIDEIRQTINFLSLKMPGDNAYKRCLIFKSFESLSNPAQNAMLKSLEEPPKDTLIILTVGSKTAVLPTIVSRLSWVNVLPITEQEAISYFSPDFAKSLIKKAYALSGGKAGTLKQLLADYDNHPLAQSIESIKAMLRLDRFERMAEINKLSKDKDFDISLYLLSLSKVLEAAMKNRLNASNRVDRKMLNDLKKVLTAEKFQKYNTNQKLLLTDIFYNL